MAYTPWWDYPRVDNLGIPDPFGGFPKPDSNIQLPDGYPVVAILPGTVTSISTSQAWDCTVTIKLDAPLNALATHTFYEHLGGFASGLSVGTHVNAGDLIGYNGGGQACGSQKVPLGFGLYSGDIYGSGNAWNILMDDLSSGQNLLNPVNLLNAAKGGSLASVQGLTYNLNASYAGGGLFDMSWLTNSPIWVFFTDPVRLLKIVTGVMLIGLALLMLVKPEAVQAGKTALKGMILA